jgi:hypothetical protein
LHPQIAPDIELSSLTRLAKFHGVSRHWFPRSLIADLQIAPLNLKSSSNPHYFSLTFG